MIPSAPSAVARYIAGLSDDRQEIVQEFRKVLFHTLPDIQEALKWNIPVYAHIRNLCYLNVGESGMILGLMHGASMNDPAGIFEADDRKMVRHILLTDMQAAPWHELPFYLQEAAILNEVTQKKSQK
ncbi:MAG: DUF1801 domain-containing protein [Bacteroidia bacterium]|nr:DUF1801 domain-containing protein [Bacteroidia bacterium]